MYNVPLTRICLQTPRPGASASKRIQPTGPEASSASSQNSSKVTITKPDQAAAAPKESSLEQVTSPAAVYEVARPILQGCHAIPTKLKILLDRVLSSLPQEEVVTIISGCGWQLEDYQRGYKLKVGAVLE